MKWIMTPCHVFGQANSPVSPNYYKISVLNTQERFDDDDEINEVLTKKDYRKRLNSIFTIIKQVVKFNEYFHNDGISSLPKIGVLKNYYNYGASHFADVRNITNVTSLHNITEVSEHDVMLLYLGWENDMTSGHMSLMHLLQTLDKLGYESKICHVAHNPGSKYNEESNTLHIEVNINNNHEMIDELDEMNHILEEKDEEIDNLKNENESLLVELIELRNRIDEIFKEPINEFAKFIDITEDTQKVSQDPFQVQSVNAIEPLKKIKDNEISPAAKAALQREAMFKDTAYGKRIYKVIQKK